MSSLAAQDLIARGRDAAGAALTGSPTSSVLSVAAIAAATPSNALSNVIYRVRQFWRGLYADVSVEERAHVHALLPAQCYALFQRMPRDAQRHSLDLFYTLIGAGHTRRDLLIAALLHDVGKVASEDGLVSLGLWLRGPLTVAEWAAPWLLERLAAADPAAGWRYTLYVQANHAAIGARWAEAAGCSALTCWLIGQHQDGKSRAPIDSPLEPVHGETGIEAEWYPMLCVLQWADSQN